MQIVPVKAVPNQSFTIVLEQQLCKININLLGSTPDTQHLYFNLDIGNVSITKTTICLNLVPLIKQPYLATEVGFAGNFIFYDVHGKSDPAYTGLGTEYLLVYLTGDEYAQLF